MRTQVNESLHLMVHPIRHRGHPGCQIQFSLMHLTHLYKMRPPSTLRTVPEMNEASSEAKKA